MKKLTLLLFVLIVSSSFGQETKESKLNWLVDFEKAKQVSKAEKKPILMLFTGSDWCPPCKMLKADFFNSKEFEIKSKDFVLLMVDLPRNIELIGQDQYQKNKELNKKYGVSSVPVVIATNYKGAIIDKIKSYNAARETKFHFRFLEKVLKKYKK